MQVCSKLCKCVQKNASVFEIVQVCSKSVQVCSKLCKCVQNCASVFEIVQVCARSVQVCAKKPAWRALRLAGGCPVGGSQWVLPTPLISLSSPASPHQQSRTTFSAGFWHPWSLKTRIQDNVLPQERLFTLLLWSSVAQENVQKWLVLLLIMLCAFSLVSLVTLV